jgi:hypothetical protein
LNVGGSNTNIEGHPDLWGFSASFGPLALGGETQGGQLVSSQATALFSDFQLTDPKPIDWTCFKAGTLISMANGSKKAIETVKAGDLVKSFDEVTGEFKDGRVVRTFQRTANSVLEIHLSNGEVIEVTGEHPFYSGNEWVPQFREWSI